MTSPIKYGIYYFMATSGLMTVQYLINRASLFNTTLSMITGTGLSILFIVLAIKADRNDESGYTLADAVKAGMICFGVGSLLSLIYTYILFNIVDPTLITEALEYAKKVAQDAAGFVAKIGGMNEAQTAEMLAEIEKQEIPNPFTLTKLGMGWAFRLIFPGVIISLISGAIMKKD